MRALRKQDKTTCITCERAGTRLGRALRNAGMAVALGTAALVPMAQFVAPQAEARSLVAVPSIKVPARQPGYQLATVHGDVVPFGAAASGRAPGDGLANPVVAVARTRSGAGAWTVTADGGVLTSGDAKFYGSLGGRRLNAPAVGIASTPTGRGYWLTSADGGVFAFGDAGFHGSLVDTRHNAPVVEITTTPTGAGYWLTTADGGVFTFGDATFRGSVDDRLNAPITGMAATPSGRGYWLVGSDGGVFTYGDAKFYGRPGKLNAPVVGVAASRSGRGYWVAAADGGVFTFGDAPFLGSSPGRGKVVGIAAGIGRPVPKELQALPRTLTNRYGNDISWPQCDGPMPAAGYGHGIVGVTGGRPFTRNRCLGLQWQWAVSGGSGGSVYINLASPRQGEAPSMHGPAGDCAMDDMPCQTYNHSAANVGSALEYARSVGVDAPMWWLDVEWLNHWTDNDALNALTVKAAVETLQKAGVRVGVYSTPLQWRKIVGGYRPGLPAWVAGSPTDAESPAWCERPDKDFAGGGVWLVQSLPVRYDVNYACAPAVAEAEAAFRFQG